MNYVWSFVIGGVLCVIGQILIERTRLTPARILVGYVVAGVFLSAVGFYEPFLKFASSGASVPLSGFGHLLQRGFVPPSVRTAYWGASREGLPPPLAGLPPPSSSPFWHPCSSSRK